MTQRKLLLVILFGVVLVWTAVPALAANTMTITPVWRPGQQLTSLDVNSNGVFDTGDDFRYVDVQLMITGNVQFWAVNMACALTPAVLQGYNVGSSVGDTGDDIPMVTWGPDWGTTGTDFIPAWMQNIDPDGAGPLTAPTGFNFNATSGTLTLRATRLGNVAPLGINGANYTTMLATLRMRVRQLATATGSATIKCTVMDFLDRNGRIVVKGKQAATPALAVRSGYSITGQALLQGGTNHAGIQVVCDNGVQTYIATTIANGNYSFGGTGQLIREMGRFECVYTSPIVSTIPNPRAEFLDAQIDVNLNSSTFFLLPVVLKGGNINTAAGSENDIDDSDLANFTANWSPGAVASAYTGLDVNGDSTVNEADLAMFAGNYDPQSGLSNVDGSHVLYGLATDYGGTFPNSRTFWGDSRAGAVQRLEDPKTDRDFWPAMSPDGAKVAFSRLITKTGKYVLHTTPTAKPKGVQLTPKSGFTDDGLAPSWSPDGQRIAFVCSTGGQTSGYAFNEGNLCVINANGTNLQQVATGIKVYPPAWFDDNVIIYAGTANNSNVNCQRNLCFIDLATGASGQVVAALLADGNDVADMPSIGSLANGTKALFYRFDDGTSNSLRARTLTYNSTLGVFTPAAAVTITTPGGGNDIDFYNVSPVMDVMYYESNITPVGSSSVFRTLDGFINLDFIESGGLSADDWDNVSNHSVDGFVGNITTSLFGGAWDGDLDIPTPYHAQRATFDWVP